MNRALLADLRRIRVGKRFPPTCALALLTLTRHTAALPVSPGRHHVGIPRIQALRFIEELQAIAAVLRRMARL